MLKISSLIISLLLCFSAFSQTTKKEIMLEAHKLLEKYNWKEAEKLVLELAENGDAEAQYLMSKIRNFETNSMMAVRAKKKGIKGWFIYPTERKIKKIIESNHIQTIDWLIKANSHSWIFNKNTSDEDSIRTQYVATSFNGEDSYPKGGNSLGIFKTFGTKRRLEIIRKAAEKNIYDAQFIYSNMIRSDSVESFKWLNIAANNKNTQAIYDLGIMYLFGRGVKKDINKALEYLNEICEVDFGEASYILGIVYYEGKEVARDLDKVIYYFNKTYQLASSASQLKNFSLLRIGEIYVEKKEYQKAISTYQLVDTFNNEHQYAIYKIGEIYAELGQYKKAIYWLKKSHYEKANQKIEEIRSIKKDIK